MLPDGEPCAPDLSRFRPPGFFSTDALLEPALAECDRLAARLEHGGDSAGYRRTRIGSSREGRPVWGIVIGHGERSVSLTAGAHADEPVGPITAICLIRALLTSPARPSLLAHHRFAICPQVNPDGANRNAAWFAETPDFACYLKNVIRELPGDDIEFGYPRPTGTFSSDAGDDLYRPLAALRPENEAVAGFLAPGAPYAFHTSLHGMAFSEGAFFLIGPDWADRAGPLMDRLTDRVRALGLGFHDIDRQGEKGFYRLRTGFSTTPNHVAMRAYFLECGDGETASRFQPSSMEYVRSLGGDPLEMVSELPLFAIGLDWTDGDKGLEDTPYQRLRAALIEARRFEPSSPRGSAAIKEIERRFRMTPLSLMTQVRLQGDMIFQALDFLDAQGSTR